MILIGAIEKTVFENKSGIQISVTMARINAEHFKNGYLEFGDFQLVTSNSAPQIGYLELSTQKSPSK